MISLPEIWFVLIGVLLAIYVLLDGYDLGAGFWQLFLREEKERRQVLRSIGPVWDGNEVWLLAGGGVLFAAFPPVYAAVFSGFYLALVILLLCLIARAASIELRNQLDSAGWRRAVDLAFGLSSGLAPLLLAVALGNVVRGIDLDDSGNFRGSFFALLNPFAILVGLFGLATVATHGALFLSLKTSGSLEEKAGRFARVAWPAQLALFIVASVYAFLDLQPLREPFLRLPYLLLIPLLALAALVACGVFIYRRKPKIAFHFSSLSILLGFAIAGASLYPRLVPAFPWEENSLTIFNSSSSPYTLSVMLAVAAVGMPPVIGYTIWVQRKFAYRLTETEEE